jgi:hypothetical protein
LAGFPVRAALTHTVVLLPLLMRRFTCAEPTTASSRPKPIPAETLLANSALCTVLIEAGLATRRLEFKMTAVVYKLRDYQNPRDIERLYADLEKQAADIIAEVVPYGGKGIDGMTFADKDPA